jgi:acetyl/propionyl-CoA carboxylase alpha subunit
MGVKTVAVYSDADAHAKHVMACDEAVHMGGSAPKDSYLRWERIIEAAKATGRPGHPPRLRFLERERRLCPGLRQAAGLVFIGPRASAIRAMGLKAESKRLMEAAGVPLVPGYHGANQDAALLQAEADRIGYPVLIKASAGGGGKGMRAVEQGRGLCRRPGKLQARGDQQLWRRRRADRKVRAAPAPHRNPGVWRHARPLRVPVRARLLGAAPPPEGAGRSPAPA